MSRDTVLTRVDALFARARMGDREGFAEWMGCVERPIRLALRRFATAVDVEGVVQETLMRMWILAHDRSRTLEGENASLRFAIGMARNIAASEARRIGRIAYVAPGELPEPAVPPDPEPDAGLRRAILECLEALVNRPREALLARLRWQPQETDARIAARLHMTVNTFLQNIVRARRQMADCLAGKGISVTEMLS